ncbi:hypothetical protein M1105_19925 [Limibaculum sp. FT325]|uniref:hypothetical protein n=1 Tax=Thermohalobaculum sediminis TaxID=2939436 RepID=UPI0020BD843A|nr:hypothetical protein [Limibaculum sediminis]MCL5779233.1 hypothetical protein [Limibaculum sediminis]
MLAAAVLVAPGAAAAEEFHGSATLYGWLPWIDADVTTGQGGVSASLSGGDVVDALDFTIMATADVQYGRFGAILDFIYGKFSDDATSPDFFGSNLKMSLKQTLVTGALTYRVIDRDGAFLDAMAGARFVDMSTDVTILGGGAAGLVQQSSGGATWVDPIIGLRGNLPLTKRLSVNALADIGGFGVGSDLSWEVFTGLDYAFSDRLSGRMGFRYISIDYSDNGRKFDVEFYGPALGVMVNF